MQGIRISNTDNKVDGGDFCFLCFKDVVYSDKENYNGVRREFNRIHDEYGIEIMPWVSKRFILFVMLIDRVIELSYEPPALKAA